MKTMFTSIMICALSCWVHAADIPAPTMSNNISSEGSVTVSPASGISDQFGTWIVSYRIGKDGITTQGGIRVQLPDVWHSAPRNSALRLQATEPESDNYIHAYASNPAVTLRTIVEEQRPEELNKHRKQSLDGRAERYVFVVRIVLTKGSLNAGDAIRVVYGDTSQGSRGYRGPAISAKARPILLAVDATGDSTFTRHSDQPTLTSLAGHVTSLRIHAPSNAIPNTPITLRAALLDAADNPAFGPVHVSLRYPDGVTGPRRILIPLLETGVDFNVTANAPGIVRVQATWSGESDVITANPIEITQTLPDFQLYWGDLHSHTQYSWDGVGQDAFDYARYTSGLDFYAMTDHAIPLSKGLTVGLNTHSWKTYQAETEQYHAPNEFVTLHAYECSFGTPYGHHNVYFRGEALDGAATISQHGINNMLVRSSPKHPESFTIFGYRRLLRPAVFVSGTEVAVLNVWQVIEQNAEAVTSSS